LTVFRSRSFTAGNIIGVVSGFGLFGSALMMPLYFQNVMGFTAMGTGLALLPGAIATAISLPIASRLVKWIDQRWCIAFGMLLFAVGCWMVGALNQQAAFEDTLWPRAVQGFALGFMWVPLTTATLSDISRVKMAGATGVYTLVRQLGGSLGIAILQLVETRAQDGAYAALASGVTMANQNVGNMLHGAANQAAMLANLFQAAMLNAEAIAYNDVFRLCAIVFVISIPSVLLLRADRSSDVPVEPIIE
jgi:DHA2 family multidrug resistance protein